MCKMTTGKPIKWHTLHSGVDSTGDGSRRVSNEAYRIAIQLLHEKCKALQRSNERLVFRIHKVRNMTESRERDVERLKARLDTHGDGWRTAVNPAEVKEEGEE